MNTAKKALKFLQTFWEIIVPSIAVIVMFGTFIYSIVTRYVLNMPCTWANELQAWSYIWLVLPAACYVRRINNHVRFTVVYDLLPEKGKLYMRIFGDLLIGITFLIIFPYACKYVFTITTFSPIFRINLRYIYFPFIPFILAGAGYSLYDAFCDIRSLVKRQPATSESLSKGADEK